MAEIDPIILEFQANTDSIKKELDSLDRDLAKTGQSFTKTGNQISKDLDQVASSLKAAQTESSRLGSIIKEQEKITADFRIELGRLQSEFKKAGGDGTMAGQRIGKSMDSLKVAINENVQAVKKLKIDKRDTDESVRNLKTVEKELKNQEKEIGSLEKAFNSLGKKLLAAFAVDQIISFTAEAIRLASAFSGVEKAFDKIDGANINELRDATQGAVSDLKLMQSAVNASNLGVPIERLGTLFAFASQRAAETGQNVDHLVERITSGLGRRSTLVLDNLGISTEKISNALGGVSIESASVADLTNALADSIESDLDPAFLGAASSTDKFAALMENIQVSIGEKLLPAFDETVDILTVLGNKLLGVDRTFDDAFDPSRIEGFNAELVKVTGNLLANNAAALENVSTFADFTKEQEGLNFALANQNLLLSEDVGELTDFLDSQKTAFIGVAQGSQTYATFLDQIRERIKGLADAGAEVTNSGIIEVLKEQIKLFDGQLDSAQSQQEINSILTRRLAVETQLNAILNQRTNIEDDGVDIELGLPDLSETAGTPDDYFGEWVDSGRVSPDTGDKLFEWIPSSAFRATEEAELAFDDFYERALEAKIEADRREMDSEQQKASFISEVYTNRLSAMSSFFDALIDLQVASGKHSKDLATFQAFLNLYLSISNALAQPLDPISKAIYVAAMTAQAAAQISNIQSQQPPSFYHGTDFFSDSPSKGRKRDDGLARLHYGEAVITTDANRRNKGLSKALNSGKERAWINANHIVPALRSKRQELKEEAERSFAANIASSLSMNMPDHRIVREVKKGRIVQQMMLEEMQRGQKKNPYRA